MTLHIPERMAGFREPFGSYRNRCVWGGRLSGKSTVAVQCLLELCAAEKRRAGIFRATEKSALATIYECVVERLDAMGLTEDVEIYADEFVFKTTGSRISLHGIGTDFAQAQRIKSLHGIEIALVEEAQELAEAAWLVFEPTIRGLSEIWLIWNGDPEAFIHQEFVLQEPPERSLVVELHWRHNEGIGDENRRRIVAEYRRNPRRAAHVYECRPYVEDDLLVFKNLKHARFEVPAGHLIPWRAGMDFGHTNPAAATLCFVVEGEDRDGPYEDLYVCHEVHRSRMREYSDLLDENRLFRDVALWCDSEDPKSIDKLVERGYDARPCPKPGGSVNRGLKYLESFRNVFIHESCKNTLKEMRNFRRAKDRAGNVTDDYAPRQPDHCIDSIRYALGDLVGVRKRKAKFFCGDYADGPAEFVGDFPVQVLWSADERHNQDNPALAETEEEHQKRVYRTAMNCLSRDGEVIAEVLNHACGFPAGARVVAIAKGQDALGQHVLQVCRALRNDRPERRRVHAAYPDEILKGAKPTVDKSRRPHMGDPCGWNEAFPAPKRRGHHDGCLP